MDDGENTLGCTQGQSDLNLTAHGTCEIGGIFADRGQKVLNFGIGFVNNRGLEGQRLGRNVAEHITQLVVHGGEEGVFRIAREGENTQGKAREGGDDSFSRNKGDFEGIQVFGDGLHALVLLIFEIAILPE